MWMVEEEEEEGKYVITTWIAGGFSIAATVITILTIVMHLKNYKRPDLQRSTIRILLMTPIYSLISWVAVMDKEAADYLDVIRDVYEAFVIYVFFSFLVNLMDGERSLCRSLRNREPTPPTFPFNYILKPLDVSDPYTFLHMKRGILQFALLKPFLAILIFILKISGVYEEGLISWGSSYIYIAIMYNLSVCAAMYYLLMLYFTIRHDIAEHEPTSKFLCVKAVVFFSFWQGAILSLLTYTGVIKGSGRYSERVIANYIQDFIICIEMFLASLAHTFAFGHTYYDEMNTARMPLKYALRDAFGINDVFQDSYQTILGVNGPMASSQTNGSGQENGILLRTSKKILRKANIFDLFRNLIVLFTSRPAFDGDNAPLLLNASARYSKYEKVQNNYDEEDELDVDDSLLSPEASGSNSGNGGGNNLGLTFPDIEPDSDIEVLYRQSRNFPHGDYNYPVIMSPASLRSVNNPFSKQHQKRKRLGSHISQQGFAAKHSEGGGEEDEDEDEDDESLEIKSFVNRKINRK